MRNPFKNLFGRRQEPRRVSARYDAASHSPQALRKWSQADFMLPNESLSHEVRMTIRSRARCEVENTPWVGGMLLQYAEDVISTGPRIQIVDGNDVEREWNSWCSAVDFAGKLRIAVLTKVRDGECFIQLTSNPGVRNESKLFPLLIDCSRITSGEAVGRNADGIILNQFLEPVRYQVQKNLDDATLGFYEVDAGHMCHYFRCSMPEQHRGVSDLAPALPGIAMLRAYTVAMLNKMEASATVVGVLEPDTSVIDPDSVSDPPFTSFDMPARSWMTLPSGYKSKQFQLMNPTDSQNAFAVQVKNEVARCILATKNIVLGDSSDYNYSSARLDMQSYDRAIDVARQEVEKAIIDKVFAAWWRERFGNRVVPAYTYYWPARAFVNPLQESNADTVRLQNGSLTYQQLCASEGHDWQETMRQRFEAEAYRRQLEKEFGFELSNPVTDSQNDFSAQDGNDNA